MKHVIVSIAIAIIPCLCFSNTKNCKQAKSANEFLNSIGVNSSISRRGESLEKTLECVKYLGIRWFRTGYEGNIPVEDLVYIYKNSGTKSCYGLLSGGTDINRLIENSRKLAAEGALLAIEGNNEPNNWGVIYNEEQGGRDKSWIPIAKLQRDLYQAVKNDSVLKDYPVFSICENGAETDNVGLQFLTIPEGANTIMPAGTQYADYANVHNYISHPSWDNGTLHDNQSWLSASPSKKCPVDGLYGNYGKTWLKGYQGYSEEELKTLPKVTTETGTTINDGVSEEQQACLFMNLYLSQFKQGWSYTALYLLRDRSDEDGNQTFGFYNTDYTPRKGAITFHNLTTILNDNGTMETPEKLCYNIPEQPETVHDLLLQKSDGSFNLVIWGENYTGGADTINVDFNKKYNNIKIYNPMIGTDAVQTLSKEKSINLVLTDHPIIIEIKK